VRASRLQTRGGPQGILEGRVPRPTLSCAPNLRWAHDFWDRDLRSRSSRLLSGSMPLRHRGAATLPSGCNARHARRARRLGYPIRIGRAWRRLVGFRTGRGVRLHRVTARSERDRRRPGRNGRPGV